MKNNAQRLRKEMTAEEKKLWYTFLKKLPVTINRQKVIGQYIVDFYCAKAKLVIEIDGSQHYEEKGIRSDKVRDEYLNSLGLTVLRYTNKEINSNFKNVCQDIWNYIMNPHQSAMVKPSSVSCAETLISQLSFPQRGKPREAKGSQGRVGVYTKQRNRI